MIASAALLLLSALAPAARAQLNELAVAAGLKYIGSALSTSYTGDAAYMAIIDDTSEIGQITPENEMKWDATEPTQGQFSYAGGDAVAAIAGANGQYLRCHTFTWYSQLPTWVSSGSWTYAQLEAVIQTHISNVAGHYKGKCYCWDAVNEAIDDSGNWRSDVFYSVLGTDLFPISFNAVAAADPNAKIYYNDYNLETAGTKQDMAAQIVQIAKTAGAPLDGIGFQGHLIVGETPSRSTLAASLGRFTALGLEVAYTELDIRFSAVPASASGLVQQGSDYVSVVGSCLDTKGCVGLTQWEFTDKYSWVPATFSGQGEACLYDDDLNKKPAWTSVSSLLAAAATASQPPSSSGTHSTTSAVHTTTAATSSVHTTTATSSAPHTTSSSSSTGTGQAQHWGQCGGIGWAGPTACVSPYTCQVGNPYYSQCL